MRSPRRVLVISAHMDDETFGMGGTIARHVLAKDEVTVVFVCDRAYDHRIEEKINAQERKAALSATRVLGVRDVRFLGLADERVGEKFMEVVIPLEACVNEVRPNIVYTHHRGDNNQDHRAVAQATFVACRSISRHPVRRLLCYEVLSSTDVAPPLVENAFLPNHYVDISRVLPLKVEAARAYRRELRRFPHPRSLEGIRVLAKKRGMEIGFSAAEAFQSLRDCWEHP